MAGSTSIKYPQDIRRSTLEIAGQLNTFCATHTFYAKALNLDADLIDLQLSVCRKLRELLPTSNCSALLQTAQSQRWIPVLLQWLNLHDRPAVQVESLLAVTNIAEVCAHQYSKHGNVPFPPLSFSQSLSKEAVQAFDASLTDKPTTPYSIPTPSTSSSSSSSTTAFVPPPTTFSTSFPQQNLSAGVQHLLLRHADAIPTLIELLASPQPEIFEQSLWILGSIAAGDHHAPQDKSGLSSRDVILAAGIWPRLLSCLQRHPRNLSLQRIGSWTLSNLLDQLFPSSGSNNNSSGNPSSPDLSSADEIDMTSLLPVLDRLLNMTDSEVLSYTCWSLSHLCDSAPHIGAVVAAGLAPRLVELLLHVSWRVTKPALRTIGNIVCAEASNDDDFTEVILECEAVPRLKELIGHANKEIQKEACWTLSNISAGTVTQIDAVIESGAIPVLVDLVRNPGTDQEVRSEACWVVLNATSCGSDSQIEVLVAEGCVSVLGVLLSEASMVMMALEGLERVLQVEEAGEHQPQLVSASLIEKARESHSSSAVTKRADRIWKQHFVSCALCKQSFSRHRTAEASFCEECKCHVCADCNCNIYHMDYVEKELWLSSEKTETSKTRKNKKNKKKKKKKAQEASKEKKEEEEEEKATPTATSIEDVLVKKVEDRSPSPSPVEDENQIDLVLYLQQTGSIIALSKLMDALECDEEDLDDYERKTISDIREASFQQSV